MWELGITNVIAFVEEENPTVPIATIPRITFLVSREKVLNPTLKQS
jgi:hypothetical protein